MVGCYCPATSLSDGCIYSDNYSLTNTLWVVVLLCFTYHREKRKQPRSDPHFADWLGIEGTLCSSSPEWEDVARTFLVHHRFCEWLANKLTPLLRYLHDWYVLSSLMKRVEKSGWRPRSLCPWKDLLIHQKRTIKDFFGLSDHNALWETFILPWEQLTKMCITFSFSSLLGTPFFGLGHSVWKSLKKSLNIRTKNPH